MKYFLDTYALIEIAGGNEKYEKYVEEDAVTLKENLAELSYFLLRKYDEKTAVYFLNRFSRLAAELPLEIVEKAMVFRHSHKKFRFSYIDCFGYVYALNMKLIFLTGDRAFQGLERVEIVR